MTTLYLDRKGLELKLDGAALALYEDGSRLRTVPLGLFKRIVIRAETMLSSSVLGALVDAGRSAVVLSGRQGRRLAVIQGRAHNDALLRVAQYAQTQDSSWRLVWARRFVGAKLTRQPDSAATEFFGTHSLYGAPWLQPVAINGKSTEARNGKNKAKPLPWVATSCRSEPW